MKAKSMMVMALVFMASLCSADVVFEEDFESPEAYKARWEPPASYGWALVEAEVNGRKSMVLDVTGGNEGLAIQKGLKDYDFEADFRIIKSGAGFVFGARDFDNLHTLWFPDNQKFFYPRTRTDGEYPEGWGKHRRVHNNAPPLEPLAEEIPLGQWQHVRFEVRGNRIKCFLNKKFAGEWKDEKFYEGGRFGFRCGFPYWKYGEEHMQIDNIRITTAKPVLPNLTLERSTLPRMILVGQSFEVKAIVQNTGWKTEKNLLAALSLPPGLKLVSGSQTQSRSSLKVTDRCMFYWEVKAERVSTGRMEIGVVCDGMPAAETISVDCAVNRPLPVVSGKPVKEAAARIDANGNVILENQNLCMVFAKNTQGYNAAIVYVYNDEQSRQMAVSQPIGHVAYRTAGGQDVESDILPTKCEILNAGGPFAKVRLSAEKVDEDSCQWNFDFTFKLEYGKNTVQTHYQALASKDRQLLYFQGPDLYAGEGSFGSSKSHALLPGVEFLEADEKSSSDRDMIRDYANRYAPHPYKITMPLMAVEADNCLVAVMWDPLQKWDGNHYAPNPRFASPNFKDNQDNHLMGLFLPTVPKFVRENEDRARVPYALKANKKITLEAYIAAEASAGLLDVIDHYLDVIGMPKKIDLPITYEQALEYGRIGYMKTLYDAEAQGTKLWESSKAYPSPGASSVLWRLYLDAKEPERKKMIRDRVELMVNRALKNEGEKGLTDWLDDRHANFSKYFPVSCGVRTHLLPFYIGHLEGGLAAWKKRVYDECIDTQRADGSWEYLGSEYDFVKQGDEVVIGTMTVLTGSVLKYARITGDQRALEAGTKALKHMKRFTVPRGMNTWEVPKYTPDIQAAGLAIWCYLEAYQISGNPEHLEQAKYWARSGLPFVYLWQAPNRAIMQGATIPVFGASNGFNAPHGFTWIGRPVQWCGMPYGYWTLKLSEFDQSLPWRAIGQQILDSGIQQMLMLPANRRGLFADSLHIVTDNVPIGPGFEPEMLMKSIFLLSGHGVEVDTKVLKKGNQRIHVSTGAVLKSAELTRGDRSVAFELEYPADENSYAVVAGMSSNVKIEKDGRVLGRTDDLEAAGEGWKINADGLLLLKLKQDQPLVRINVTSR